MTRRALRVPTTFGDHWEVARFLGKPVRNFDRQRTRSGSKGSFDPSPAAGSNATARLH
jgi:hypothetical protein